ncbi:hypothetical protein WME97_26580 [Sorangium sp. So ce367]|uniref:hypothetical protein n=1 Tax=Sorangium sp. So ce367 TaxID=3133305 RepID=UPI003F620A9B
MSVMVDEIRKIIHAEYDNLVALFGLRPLPLDVYVVDDSGAGGTSAYGTDRRNATPGYTPTHIVLPQEQGDLDYWRAVQPPFPPTCWDRHSDEWPAWRTDLWHEVAHQYQHQILKDWNVQDGDWGHAKGWPQSLAAMASRFTIGSDKLLGVL